MSEAQVKAAAGGATVMARKLAAAKEEPGGPASALTLKALRRSVARAAADLCELPLAVLAARQACCGPDDLSAYLSDKHLLVVLDGPDGRPGAASMDAATVTALIQQQTMGTVMGKAPDARNYTPTDAAMTADFLEKAFAKVISMLDGQPDQALFDGFRFGAQVEGARNLLLGLEAEDYRVIELTMDLASGAMQGQMALILPEPLPEDAGSGDGAGASGPSLGKNMGNMRAELTAVLCKMRVPLNELAALKTGDVLPLEQAFLYETDLRAINGQSIAQGRLGQKKGARAVRLNEAYGLPTADAGAGGFMEQAGSGTELALPEPPPALDLGIAAQGLQDPMDENGGLMDGLGGAAGGLGDLPGMEDLPALDDLPPLDGGFDSGAPDAAALDLGGFGGDLPDLAAGDFGGLNSEDTVAEISELAGLGGELPALNA